MHFLPMTSSSHAAGLPGKKNLVLIIFVTIIKCSVFARSICKCPLKVVDFHCLNSKHICNHLKFEIHKEIY